MDLDGADAAGIDRLEFWKAGELNRENNMTLSKREMIAILSLLAAYALCSGVATKNVGAETIQVINTSTQSVQGDFNGRVVEVNYSQNWILVENAHGAQRQVLVRPEMINSYRVGDYVQVRPAADLTIVTLEENPRDFEGQIIRVDIPNNQIVVLDTNGRERRVDMKQGMIGTYKVDDYVRIHLMADLKEAKTIETVRNIRRIEGDIVSIDPSRSQIVVRDSHGKDTVIWVRQGLVTNYTSGQRVLIYTLPDRDQAQSIRIIVR